MKATLHLALLDDSDATFVNGQDVTIGAAISVARWAELGKPSSIDITIEAHSE